MIDLIKNLVTTVYDDVIVAVTVSAPEEIRITASRVKLQRPTLADLAKEGFPKIYVTFTGSELEEGAQAPLDQRQHRISIGVDLFDTAPDGVPKLFSYIAAEVERNSRRRPRTQAGELITSTSYAIETYLARSRSIDVDERNEKRVVELTFECLVNVSAFLLPTS